MIKVKVKVMIKVMIKVKVKIRRRPSRRRNQNVTFKKDSGKVSNTTANRIAAK